MSHHAAVSKSGGSKKSLKTKVKIKPSHAIFELENQFILRIPEDYGQKVKDDIDSGTLKDKLRIELHDNSRYGAVRYGDTTFSAKLVNLPCATESWKTLDRKSFWKTADVAQMLLCKEEEDSNESSSEEEETKNLDPFKKQQTMKKFLYPHGITPPLKNVRKKRFRKTAKKKYIEAPEIEKEVKRLLRADISAVDVTYEVLQDEDKQEDARSNASDIDVGNMSPQNFNEESMQSPISYAENEDSNAILPDISSSEEEMDMIDDFANSSHLSKGSLSDLMMTGASQESEEVAQRLAELQGLLVDVQAKRAEQESRVENASNPFLKQRFQAALDGLLQKESMINNEMKDLQKR